jgi:hypothetical protein
MHHYPLLMAISACSAFAQGTIFFSNVDLYDPALGVYTAFVSYADGSRIGSEFSAGLYVLRGNSESLVAATRFRDVRPGQLSPVNLRIDGTTPGESVLFKVKVWETAAGSYESALQNGFCTGVFPTRSGDDTISIVLTGTPGPGETEARLNGLLPFSLACIPEPRTSAIFLLGLLALYSVAHAKASGELRKNLTCRKPSDLV